MRITKYAFFFLLLLGACSSFGPSPKDATYIEASKMVPGAKEAVFLTTVRFVQPKGEPILFKGRLVSPTEVFFGRLIVTPDKLIIVTFDEEEEHYNSIFETLYSEIENFSAIRELDNSITYHLEIAGKIYWISATFPLDQKGEEIDGRDIRVYIRERLPQ